MIRKENTYTSEDSLLLKRFNDRERGSFGIVYLKYSKEFLYFAKRIFANVQYSAEDALQDIFISIWNNKERKFDTFENLKVYLYVSLKNKCKEICNHNKCVEKYNDLFASETSFSTHIAESEVLSVLSEAADLLPSECAKVFLLHIDGWDVKDIAMKLNKTESTVYKQKREAISIIRQKLRRDKLIILFPYFF